MKRKITYLSIAIFILMAATLLYSFSGNRNALKNNSTNNNDENKTFTEKITSLFESKKSAPKELAPAELIAWCENNENGLIPSKVISDIEYTAFYKPTSYIALKEYHENDLYTITDTSINKKIKNLGDMEYFNFRIKSLTESTELLKVKLKNESEYYSRIEYFSFNMQNDFILLDGTDTLNCLLYHFERVYGLSNSATMILGFEKRKNKADLKILFNDKVFNSGNIILNIKQSDIDNIPKLKL